MKTIIITLISICTISCVQKSYDQKVKVILDVSKETNIKKVGVRGQGGNLSWEEDTPMKEVYKDSIYEFETTVNTGYKFGEIKFTINDTFELENQDNRRVYFDEDRNTEYRAIFNKLNN